MPDFLIPGLGPFTPFVRGIVAALRPGGSTPATAETTAAYELERSRQQQEELWDYPFGAPTQSIIGSMSPAPAPSGGMTSPEAPTPPPPSIPAPAAASPLDNAIRATEASPFERAVRATEAERWSLERQIRATEGAFGFGGLVRVFGGIGALLWPSSLGSGELTPEELLENERRFERERPPTAPILGPPIPPGPPPPPFELLPMPQPSIPTPRAPRPSIPDFSGPESFARPAEMPQATRSAPSPAPSTSPQPFAQSQPLWRWLPIFGAGSAPAPFAQFGIGAPAPAPSTNPLTQLQTAPLPSRLDPFRRDHCEPRTRKPRRKCRVRAPLIWAGGPKSGQPAGTRCIEFEV
jgi:hypothetical protein